MVNGECVIFIFNCCRPSLKKLVASKLVQFVRHTNVAKDWLVMKGAIEERR